MDVFATDDSCILTEFRQFPSGAWEIHGVVAAGNKDTIVKELIPLAEEYGRERGCIIASIESRAGWARALPDYELHQVILRKDI